jgi:hypothetical protein
MYEGIFMKLGINILPSCILFSIVNKSNVAFQIGVKLTSFNIDPKSLSLNMEVSSWFFTDANSNMEIKLFLGLIDEDVWGSGVIDPNFLTSARDRSAPAALAPKETASGTYRPGGPTAGPSIIEERKFLSPTGNKTRAWIALSA